MWLTVSRAIERTRPPTFVGPADSQLIDETLRPFARFMAVIWESARSRQPYGMFPVGYERSASYCRIASSAPVAGRAAERAALRPALPEGSSTWGDRNGIHT